MRGLKASLVAALVVAVPAAAAPAIAAEQRVGVSTAVNPAATSISPGTGIRTLRIGEDIAFNEKITTDAEGQAQILFLDRSAFTIGPNSEIVIDDFVYDPAKESGRIVATASKGLFRFVGGAISKNPGGVTVNTPAATIGIRGAVGTFSVAPGGTVEATLLYGRNLTVTGRRGEQQALTRAGFSMIYDPQRGGFTTPGPATDIGALMRQFDGRRGRSGGGAQTPTDGKVAQSGVGAVNSGDVEASVADGRKEGRGGKQRSLPSPGNPNPAPGDAASASAGITIVPFVARGAAPPPIASGLIAGRFRSTSGDPSLGFTVNTPAGGPFDQGFVVPLSGGSLDLTLLSGTYHVDLPASGAFMVGGAGDAAAGAPIVGRGFVSADRDFLFVSATSTTAPVQRSFLFGGVAAPPPANGAIRAYALQPDAALDPASAVPAGVGGADFLPFVRSGFGGAPANRYVSPLYWVTRASGTVGDTTGAARDTMLQASLALEDLGNADQRSAIVVMTGQSLNENGDGRLSQSGVVVGSARSSATAAPSSVSATTATVKDGAGGRFYGASAPDYFVIDQNAYTAANTYTAALASEQGSGSGSSYGFTHAALATPPPPALAPARTGTVGGATLAGFAAGSVDTDTLGKASFAGTISITTDPATNRVRAMIGGDAVPAGRNLSYTMAFGGLAGAYRDSSAYIDDRRFAALASPTATATIDSGGGHQFVSAQHLYLVTADSVGISGFEGVPFCQCEYTRWGFWGGDLTTAAGDRRDRFHINFWVAGSPAVTLPTGGVASYDGHAIGSVVDGTGASAIRAGVFHGDIDFGARTSAVTIANFDGRTFTTTAGGLSGNAYTATLAGPAGFTGTANGMLYRAGPSAVGETGGAFRLTGAAGLTGPGLYQAAGVFLGRRN